ncbi:MAG: PilZ domain-containing protein [Pseudomonadota bacterium]
MTWEQRKTIRFKPRKRIFAALGSDLSQVGKIIDVSLGGVSFEFISDLEAGEEKTHVDIFTLDDGLRLTGLPCSLIYQLSESLPHLKGKTEEAFKARRCGLKFDHLRREQWCNLSELIEKNAVKQHP